MSIPPGAPAALRGYRLQHLYVLKRLLCDKDATELAFQLEGTEDVEVYSRSTDALIEAIQVKAHSSNITLSDLFSEADSFFHRAKQRLNRHPESIQKIVSYGPFGERFEGAIGGKPAQRKQTERDLLRKGVSKLDIDRILAKTRLEVADETDLDSSVHLKLQNSLAGADPKTAFLFLSGWTHRATEARLRITIDDIHERLMAIGQFINESAFEHLNWNSVISPISNSVISPDEAAQLNDEFYKGTFTTIQHIQANLDVVRADKIAALKKSFIKSNTVVVHGASGQGKTALAYRYLLDYADGAWRFEIRHLDNDPHALQIGFIRVFRGQRTELWKARSCREVI